MSGHTPAPWHQYQARPSDAARTIISHEEQIVAIIESGSAPADRALMTASPAIADALWNLMAALGKHSPNFSQDALADICPACDAAAAALIASGRVLG